MRFIHSKGVNLKRAVVQGVICCFTLPGPETHLVVILGYVGVEEEVEWVP